MQAELAEVAKSCSSKINNVEEGSTIFTSPFTHIVLDDFLPKRMAQRAMDAFPDSNDSVWEWVNEPGIEVKARSTWKSEFDIPDDIVDVIRIMNSALLLQTMSDVLGIPKLMPDPYFSGGGLNMSECGGHLDVHVDGNYHDASGMNRRVNMLLYFNPNWQPSWGGEFGIYEDDGEKLVKEIAPTFNRCVIFDTHDKSYHGLPNPIAFPENEPRKSIILYYYTVDARPNSQVLVDAPHSALWKSKGFLDKRNNRTREFD